MTNAMNGVCIGVSDAETSLAFYRRLGFEDVLSDSTGYLRELEPVIGALLEARLVTVRDRQKVSCLRIVEHTSTRPIPAPGLSQWGDSGYLELGLRASLLEQLYLDLKNRGVKFITPVRSLEGASGVRRKYAYLRDPDGLLLQLVEVPGGVRPGVGGIHHVGIGVRDMEDSRRFYGLLGFDRVLEEFKGRLPELDEITGRREIEILILAPSKERGPGSPLLKLIRTPGHAGRPVLEGRRWGDIGIAEAEFVLDDLGECVSRAMGAGTELFGLPSRLEGGQGLLAYVRSPEGAIIRLTEGRESLGESRHGLKRALDRLKGSVSRPGSDNRELT